MLGFSFRMAEPGKWEYIMGRDLILQPDEYLRVLKEQYALVLDNRMPPFKLTGMFHRIFTLKVFTVEGALSDFLQGNLHEEKSGKLALSFFAIDDKAPPSSEKASFNSNREMVAVLENLQLVLALVFSPLFSTVLEDLVKAFIGEDQALHFLRTDKVLYRIDVCLRSCFRAISSDKGRRDFFVKNPDKCNTYLREEVTKVVAHLSNPARIQPNTFMTLMWPRGKRELWTKRSLKKSRRTLSRRDRRR
jgi:hypothetical protein